MKWLDRLFRWADARKAEQVVQTLAPAKRIDWNARLAETVERTASSYEIRRFNDRRQAALKSPRARQRRAA